MTIQEPLFVLAPRSNLPHCGAADHPLAVSGIREDAGVSSWSSAHGRLGCQGVAVNVLWEPLSFSAIAGIEGLNSSDSHAASKRRPRRSHSKATAATQVIGMDTS